MENTVGNHAGQGFQVEVPYALEDGPLTSPSVMFKGLDWDGTDVVMPGGSDSDETEQEEGNKVETVGGGQRRCTGCAIVITKPLMLNRNPHCLYCADSAARAWLALNLHQLDSLTPAQQRTLFMNILFEQFGISRAKHRLNRDRLLLLADHYSFCQECLDPNAQVEIVGQSCNACQNFQRCCDCGRSLRVVGYLKDCSRLVYHLADCTGGLCSRCHDKRPAQFAIPPGTCLECSRPTGSQNRKYCHDCTTYLRILHRPNRCSRCKLQAKPESHKWCLRCQADRQKALEFKRFWKAKAKLEAARIELDPIIVEV